MSSPLALLSHPLPLRITLVGSASGAADSDVFLSFKDDDPRQLVVAVSQEDRAALPDALNGREQFVRSRDTDHFAWGRRQRRRLLKPGRDSAEVCCRLRDAGICCRRGHSSLALGTLST